MSAQPFPPRGWSLLLLMLLLTVAALAADVRESVLPNGLRVLIKEVHAAPVVTVDVWYKVGSRNERAGMTGSSHLLEHMTYKGTKDFSKDEMRNLAKRNGALDNGATFYDYTHYYTTIASDRLELALRLEAGRMQGALIRQEDLDSEMTVVRSELEGRENDPGFWIFNELMASAFKTSPYHWPVIGWRADIEKVTADQLRAYYQVYYIPNNATLVIAGDINADNALALAKKYFGRIPKGAAPSQWTTPEMEQRGERRVMVNRQGQVPIVDIGWHIPDINHPDIPALMMLEQVLGSGRLSRIYQKIVETKLGVGAWAGSMVLRDAGLFMVGGAAAPGQPIKPIEEAALAEVERIKSEPPTAEEMARGLRQQEASLVYSRDSVTQQAEQLGYYATVAGDWRYLDNLPEKLRKVTPEEVSQVAKKYLTEENRTVAIFQPTARGKQQQAMVPTATPAGYRSVPEGPQARRNIQISGDRPFSRVAAATPAAAPKSVQRERFVLPNGLVLLVQENHANPLVAMRVTLKAGKAYDPAGKAGTADMAANLLDRGTTTRSSTQIAGEMEGAAADLSTSTGWETAGMSGKALSGDTELLIRNAADMLRNATFPAEEVEKMREQMLAGIAYSRDEPDENARRVFYRTALPEGHPYRLTTFDEDQDGLKAITRDDLLAFYHTRYVPGTVIIALVGDVRASQVRELVTKYFGDWQGQTPKLLSFTTVTPDGAKQVVTKIAEKSEVDIYVGHAGTLRRTDPDYYAAQLMNLILGGGGALNSRLGDVIRDKQGLVYTVYSAFHASTGAGPWYAMLGTNPQNADKAIASLKAEITRMHDQGVTQQEVRDAISFITGARAIALETNGALANELADNEYFNLGLDYPEKATALYAAVTREQVSAAARKYLHPDKLVISIAGSYEK